MYLVPVVDNLHVGLEEAGIADKEGFCVHAGEAERFWLQEHVSRGSHSAFPAYIWNTIMFLHSAPSLRATGGRVLRLAPFEILKQYHPCLLAVSHLQVMRAMVLYVQAGHRHLYIEFAFLGVVFPASNIVSINASETEIHKGCHLVPFCGPRGPACGGDYS